MSRKVFKFSQNPVITGVTAGHVGTLLLRGGFPGSERYLLNQGSEKRDAVDCRYPEQPISTPARLLVRKGQAIGTQV